MHKTRIISGACAALLLAGCASGPSAIPEARPTAGTGAAPATSSAPQSALPMPVQTPTGASAGTRFIAPTVLDAPGLSGVIGANAGALESLFGPPRLRVREGDALKLQFTGQPCVLDIFLYPLREGAEPSATHVESRRASDGQSVDRAACVAALKR